MFKKGLSITEARRKLDSGEMSSAKLTKGYLDKIKDKNPSLNAYLSVDNKGALGAAKESDTRRQKGEVKGPLDGIPIAVKDNLCVRGGRTTAASKILEDYIAPYDATVVKLLKEAGTVVLGKTNLDEFAMGSSTENSAYGVCKNPWDISRVPGGSSGGSAAAVAADLCVAAIGSDTGGSIRLPASFCGTVGHKPTYGAVSRYGLIAMCSSFDQVGPLTKTVADAEILMSVLAQKDPLDATSVGLSPNPEKIDSLKGIKIGVPKEYFGEGMERGVKKAVEEAIEKAGGAGAEIIDISLPHTKYALALYYIIVPAEVSSNLARFDGIRFGLSTEKENDLSADSYIDVYNVTRAEGFGPEAKRRIMLGSYVLSAGYYDAYYKQAQRVRVLVKKDFDEAFAKVDVLLTPVSPTTAFKIGEKIDDPLTMYLQDVNTVPINPAGVPAVSIPCGLSNNLPVGLQLIGPHFGDFKLLEIAKEVENILE